MKNGISSPDLGHFSINAVTKKMYQNVRKSRLEMTHSVELLMIPEIHQKSLLAMIKKGQGKCGISSRGSGNFVDIFLITRLIEK